MSSFDKIIRNILADIFAEEEQQQVTRPRARPEGIMSSLRPQARPEPDEPIQPSASESTSKFTKLIGDNEDTPEEGVEIPLNELKINARDMEGRYQTSAAQFYRLNKDIPSTGSKVKVAKLIPDTEVDELTSEIKMILDSTPTLKPRARPKNVEDIDVATSAMALGVIPIKGKRYTPTIRDTQIMLDSAGYNVGKIDGIDGPLTQAAVKAFQKDAGFTGRDVDGKFGPKTLAAFIEKNPQVTKERLPITKEELPSVKENTISVIAPETSGPPTVPSDLRTPLGTARAASIREQQEGIPTARLENLQDAQVSSIIDNIPVPESIKKGIKNVSMVTKAVLSPVGRNFMNDILFGGKLGYVNPLIAIPGLGIDKKAGMLGLDYKVGAEVFSEDALNLMRQMVLDKGIIDKGSVSIGKEVYGKGGLSVKQTGGASAKEIVKSLAEGSDPINEIKLMLGQFNAKIDDNGDIIVTDQFNYNEIINPIDGKKYTPEQYDKAIEDGKFTEAEVLMNILEPIKDGELNYEMVRALGFVLGSRSYEDEDKRQGRLFEINLGPAVTRPRARPDN